MKRHWQIRRQFQPTADGARRWDQAYQPMVLVAYKPINMIVLAGLIVMGMHFLQAG
jgi:hypothetical protein